MGDNGVDKLGADGITKKPEPSITVDFTNPSHVEKIIRDRAGKTAMLINDSEFDDRLVTMREILKNQHIILMVMGAQAFMASKRSGIVVPTGRIKL